MGNNNMKNYDIIGDIHGHADPLIRLFNDLGYTKNDAYKYEKELRIVMPQIYSDNHSLGIRLPLKSLDSLIRSVVVSPDADNDFIEAVTDLCKRYGLKSPVRRSKLSFIPV